MFMSVKLNRPPKPEESQKKLQRKTIPYPGFEPGTSGLAVGVGFLRTYIENNIFNFYNIFSSEIK
jgi:hypothetical protein